MARLARNARGVAVIVAIAVVVVLVLLATRPPFGGAGAAAEPSSATTVQPRSTGPEGLPETDLPARAPPPAPASEGTKPAAPGPEPAPVPATQLPRDTPLADVFDELAHRADQGDADAACRLAWDLNMCRLAAALSAAGTAALDDAARAAPGSPGEAAEIRFLDWFHRLDQRSRLVCDGLGSGQLGQIPQRMLQAGRLGHALSMSFFASGAAFRQPITLAHAEPMLHLQDQAFPLLQHAAAAGEPTGLFLLYRACSLGFVNTGLGQIEVGRDPGCALAAALALRDVALGNSAREAEEAILQLLAELDGEAIAAAERQAGRYREATVRSARQARDFDAGIFGPDVGETCVPAEAAP